MTDQELKDLVAGLALAQKKTDERLAGTNAQLAETDVQLTKLETKIDRLAEMYGDDPDHPNSVAEQFYFDLFKDDLMLQGIHFDAIDKGFTRAHHGLWESFDILLSNEEDVFIIEVEHEAQRKDLERLTHRKFANFRKLFPEYGKHNHYLGLASFYMDDATAESALQQGVTVLRRKGDVIETLPKLSLH